MFGLKEWFKGIYSSKGSDYIDYSLFINRHPRPLTGSIAFFAVIRMDDLHQSFHCFCIHYKVPVYIKGYPYLQLFRLSPCNGHRLPYEQIHFS